MGVSKKENIWAWAKDRDALIPVFKQAVKMIEDEGTVEVSIFPIKLTRSVAQNRLMWLWFDFLERHSECGGTKDEIHEGYKELFIPKITIDIMGETFFVQPGTKNMKVNEFSDFLKRVEFHAADFHGVTLPQPEELYLKAQVKYYENKQ